MKVVIGLLSVILMLVALWMGAGNQELQLTLHDDDCTKSLEAECAVYIEKTAKSCAKVFATEGASIISDIKCARDIQEDRKKCWPCLCAEAKK